MVAYSFQQRFRESILAGTKRQTIRSERKRHARAGEALQLYTGMRTRQCSLILRTVCLDVAPVRLRFNRGAVVLSGVEITDPRDLDDFARADGFQDWRDLFTYWGVMHPQAVVFDGVLIRWTPTAE